MFLIHGLLVNGQMFDPILPLLTSEYDLIIPDLRGYGQSRHLPPPYDTAQHVADLLALLDELHITQVDMLGYSHGGAIAQQFAYTHPQRVHRLILVCTYAYNMLTRQEKIEGVVSLWMVRLFGTQMIAKMVVSLPELNPTQKQLLRGMMADNPKQHALKHIRELQRFDSRGWLKEIVTPTMIIAGEKDNAVPIHHAQMLYQHIPHATLHIIPDATHTLIWTHPSEFINLIKLDT